MWFAEYQLFQKLNKNNNILDKKNEIMRFPDFELNHQFLNGLDQISYNDIQQDLGKIEALEKHFGQIFKSMIEPGSKYDLSETRKELGM